jgi:hypothetical protein
MQHKAENTKQEPHANASENRAKPSLTVFYYHSNPDQWDEDLEKDRIESGYYERR